MLKLSKYRVIKKELKQDLKRSFLALTKEKATFKTAKKDLIKDYNKKLKQIKKEDKKEYNKQLNIRHIQRGKTILSIKKLTKDYYQNKRLLKNNLKSKLNNLSNQKDKFEETKKYKNDLMLLKKEFLAMKYSLTPNWIKQLFILTKLNLSDNNATTKDMRHLSFKYIILFLFGFIVLTYGFYFGFTLFKGASGLDISPLKPFIKAFISFVIMISVISSGLLLAKKLFDDKRLSILETFPVNKSLIYYAKLLATYLIELKKSFLIYLALFLGYGLTFPYLINIYYLFKVLIVVLTLPLFTIAIGQMIAYAVRIINKIIGKNIISYILIGISFLLIAISFITLFMEQFQNGGKEISKQSILLALHSLFNYKLSDFTRYSIFSNILFKFIFFRGSIFYILNFLALLSMCALLLLISPYMYLFISKIKITPSSTSLLNIKKFIKTPLYFLTLIKEFKETTRDIKQLVSIMLYAFLMPLIFYFLNSFFKLVVLTSLGRQLVYLGEMAMGVLLLTSGNFLAATIISREEQNIYFLKTNPQNIFSIILGKLTIPFIINLGVIITNLVLNDITSVFFLTENIALHIIFLLAILIHSAWVAEIDIEMPDQETYKDSDNIGDNKNIFKAIFVGILLAVIITLFSFILINKGAQLIFTVLIPILTLFLGYRICMLIIKTKVYLRWLV